MSSAPDSKTPSGKIQLIQTLSSAKAEKWQQKAGDKASE